MTRKEIGELLMEIEYAYPGRIKLDENTPVIWYKYMRKQPASKVFNRLREYVTTNKFPPAIADLYRQADERKEFDQLASDQGRLNHLQAEVAKGEAYYEKSGIPQYFERDQAEITYLKEKIENEKRRREEQGNEQLRSHQRTSTDHGGDSAGR